LYHADLRGVNLYGADLRGADLRGVNLYGADLSWSHLTGTDLYRATWDPDRLPPPGWVVNSEGKTSWLEEE